MKNLDFNQMENINGGICINRPDPGQEQSGIDCAGLCLASPLVVGLTGDFPLGFILC